MLVETGGVSAESSTSGVLVNMVPKDGGNSFRFNASALFTDDSLQNDNLTDEIRTVRWSTCFSIAALWR